MNWCSWIEVWGRFFCLCMSNMNAITLAIVKSLSGRCSRDRLNRPCEMVIGFMSDHFLKFPFFPFFLFHMTEKKWMDYFESAFNEVGSKHMIEGGFKVLSKIKSFVPTRAHLCLCISFPPFMWMGFPAFYVDGISRLTCPIPLRSELISFKIFFYSP